MKIKLTNQEIREHLGSASPEFPKYTTQLINLANQNVQGTRPRVVGQLSELIQAFPGKRLAEWEKWYLKQHPEAINIATNKIVEMLEHLKKAMNKIDRNLVEQWVKDLVIVKTFIGLRFQEEELNRCAVETKVGASTVFFNRTFLNWLDKHRFFNTVFLIDTRSIWC